jgi:hypothetical protein
MNRFTASDRETEAYLKLLKIQAELVMDRPGAWECVEAIAVGQEPLFCPKVVVQPTQRGLEI